MSRTFKPNMYEINKIPQPFLSEWIEALKTSKQHKESLCDGKGSYCCLGVGLKLMGHSDEEMHGPDSPYSGLEGYYTYPSCVPGSEMPDLVEGLHVTDCGEQFACLNDEHLTHPQIAELLSGNEVTIEDAA